MAAALCAICSTTSLASDIRREVTSGKAAAVLSIIAFEPTSCAAYPAHNIKITKAPEHGSAELLVRPVSAETAFPHCKGKTVKPTFVIYRSSPGFRGDDHVSVTFTRATNTGEMSEAFYSYDIGIAIK